tara:strand:+ start:320 stop:652 length:333 start_codon:yes stop_codon:yes gene_type:complete
MVRIKLAWEETTIYEDDNDSKSIDFNEYFIGETIEDCINEAAENYDWQDHFGIDFDCETPPPIETYRDLKNIFIDNNGVWEDADLSVYHSWDQVVETEIARENVFERTRQ